MKNPVIVILILFIPCSICIGWILAELIKKDGT